MTPNSTAVAAGIGSSNTMFGNENHLAKIVGLTSGVATEIAATPAMVNHKLPRAQRTARSCNSPSDLMMSQPAPSRQYAATSAAPMTALKTIVHQSEAKPVMSEPSM